MNSQRLEEIVAELMKPISDIRRSFDTDLSALLEEYLTEAGLRALDGEGEGVGAGGCGGEAGAGGAVPNFAELALLVQQSACIYSRKVDCLYQHVLSVSDALHASAQETTAQSSEPQTPSGRRRRRGSGGGALEFSAIELSACGAARRQGAARPPPTLPRGYIELEPRVLGAADRPALDYHGEPIGLLADFEVTWRLQDGLLVDELQTGGAGAGAAGAGAGRARAPLLPDPPASPPHAQDHDAPLATPPSSPPHAPPDAQTAEAAPLASSTPQPQEPQPQQPQGPARVRKRRSDVHLDELAGCCKLHISAEVRARLARVQEFSVCGGWVSRVVAARKQRVLAARRRLAETEDAADAKEFRGFDISGSTDIGGFRGWSILEAALAARSMRRLRLDSDDDGFFELSSSGDSDDLSARQLPAMPASSASAAEWEAWCDAVVARAAAAAEAGPGWSDVRAAGAAVLRAAAALAPPAACDALLAATVRRPEDVARVFLATLFLANAGSVQIEPGAPLSLNSFAVRVLAGAPEPPPR